MKDVLIVFKLLTSYRPPQWPEEIKIAGRYIWPHTERVWSTSQLISSLTTIVTKRRSRNRKCLKSLQKTVQGYRAWKIFQMVIKPIYIYIYIYRERERERERELYSCPLSCMSVKLGRWHWGRNVGWGCLRKWCWGDNLGPRGTR